MNRSSGRADWEEGQHCRARICSIPLLQLISWQSLLCYAANMGFLNLLKIWTLPTLQPAHLSGAGSVCSTSFQPGTQVFILLQNSFIYRLPNLQEIQGKPSELLCNSIPSPGACKQQPSFHHPRQADTVLNGAALIVFLTCSMDFTAHSQPPPLQLRVWIKPQVIFLWSVL